MGWAKYAEDDFEAMEDRWFMRDAYTPTTTYSNYSWRNNTYQNSTSTYSWMRQNESNIYRTTR